jgi:hypothetical protein
MYERLVVDVMIPRSALQRALRSTDPRVALSTHEERCWLEAAVERCLRRGEFSIQSITARNLAGPQ